MVYMVFARVDGFSNILSSVCCARTPYFSLFSSRKGQRDAGSAANLIAMLGLFLILYILFVPPAERDLLLSGGTQPPGETPSDGALISYLINTQPGKLHYFFESDFEHPIPPFTLRESKYSNILYRDNSFVLRRSWFSNTGHEIKFSLPSVRDATGVKLTFDVTGNPKGNLMISLNGRLFFNRELSSGMVNPIDLPLEYLSSENVLEFLLSPADIVFWRPNNYQIADFVLAGDFIDPTNLENSHRFFLNDLEKNNLGEARLLFSPSCNRHEVGKLSVLINGQTIYSAIPNCNNLNNIHFLPNILQDENIITFVSTEGEYLISLGNIRTRITDKEQPTFYFEIPSSTYEKLRTQRQYIELELSLQDDEKFKEAYILVNSVKFFLNTRTNSHTRRIPFEVLEQGTNSIQIQPLNSFEVIRLRVGLYDN